MTYPRQAPIYPWMRPSSWLGRVRPGLRAATAADTRRLRELPAIIGGVLLPALACALSVSPALAGETRIVVREDGVKMIMNEPSAARARRLADRLYPIPFPAMAEAIERHAADRALDPKLVRAVVQVESGYNVDALSNKGAMGLMQLMPGTARELAVDDPWDPEQNVRGGVTYLKRMLSMFSDDLDFALAAYNAGPNAVLEHAGIPPYAETRAYVAKVRCLYDGDCPGSSTTTMGGRKVQVVRDGKGGLVLTTSGPGG